MTLELTLLCAYLAFGPQAWSFYGTMLYAGRRKMLLLKRPNGLDRSQPLPSVTILIPAKDEGERIRACISSCLEQDYPNFNVIAINDRSTDNTGAVMDEMAAEYGSRLTVFHNQTPPPPGWTGKNNVLWQGQKLAQGEWLLFVDSDVVLDPDVLSASMAVNLRKKFDMLSLLPRLESHTMWESLLVPLAASAASSMYLIALTNNNQLRNTAFGNGQFMLMTRKSYDAFGGHETVKDRFCEDVAIARLMKSTGWQPRVAWASEFCAVRMYSSLENIFKGWSRIFYSAQVGSPWRTIAAAAFVIFCCFSAYVALGWGIYRAFVPTTSLWGHMGAAWIIASLAHLAFMTFFLGKLYQWSGNPRRNALLFPIGGTLLMGIFYRALKMCVTKKVEWRGTAYSHVMATELPTTGRNPA